MILDFTKNISLGLVFIENISFFLLLFFVCVSSLHGQVGQSNDIDFAIERTVNPVERCSLYYERAEALFSEWKLEEAVTYYRKALELAEKQNDLLVASRCIGSIGAAFQNRVNVDSALVYTNRALDIIEGSKGRSFVIQRSILENQLGIIYQTNGLDTEKALLHFDNSLKLAQEVDDEEEELSSYIGLALYYSRYDNKKCLKYGKEGIKLAKKLKKDFEKAELERVMASSILLNYKDSTDIGKVPIWLKACIPFYKQQDSFFELGASYLALGKYYFLTNALDSAQHYFQSSLGFFNKIADTSSVIQVNWELARLSYKKGDYQEAINILMEYKHSSAVKQDEELTAMFKELEAKSFAKTGRYKEAYETLLAYKRLSDSLFQKNWNSEVLRLQEEFNADWLEKNQVVLERKNKDLQLRNLLFLWVGVLFLLLWIGGGLSYLKLKRKNELIEKQKRELESLNITKDRLFSVIAHDLRTPLIALGGLTKKIRYLLKKNKIKEVYQLGDKVETSLIEVQHLTDNLLNWALAEQGRLPLKPKVVDIGEIFEICTKLYQTAAEAKKIHLEVVPLSEKVFTFVDENAICAVLRNLLDNAIKFTHEEGRIRIFAVKKDDKVIIQVADTGIGIRQELLNNLFTLNGNIFTTGTKDEKGSGLGLVLCKELIEKNGGTISAESEIGKGTTFFLTLPVVEPE